MIEQRAIQVAHARAKLLDATRAVDDVAARLNEVNQRIVDAQARTAAALAGLRSGELQEDVGAARLAIANADIADLEELAARFHLDIAAAEQTRRVAEDALRGAEAALAQTERAAAIQGLNEIVVQLEANLCAAIGERHRLAVEQSGGGFLMLSRSWTPSQPLFAAVMAGVPPTAPDR
jgi:chromosome segregation ATPase